MIMPQPDNESLKSATELCTALSQLRWPDGKMGSEVSFNRDCLLELLRSVEGIKNIEAIRQETLRCSGAKPFFGWGACRTNKEPLRINGHVKTDLTFLRGVFAFFVENKIVKPGRECDIKNAFVQAVEYLNLYDVTFGLVLILDDGKGRGVDWKNNSESTLIDLITACYPLCVVRVRKGREPEIFWKQTGVLHNTRQQENRA